MASRFQLDKPRDKPTRFDYRGLVIWISPDPSIPAWNKVRAEQMTDAGLVPGEIAKLDEDEQSRWYGRSMVGTLIHNIESFEIEQTDGTVDRFDFDGVSDMDCYETEGEELLGENITLQNDVFAEVMRLVRYKPEYEVRALGNSSRPVDSGE